MTRSRKLPALRVRGRRFLLLNVVRPGGGNGGFLSHPSGVGACEERRYENAERDGGGDGAGRSESGRVGTSAALRDFSPHSSSPASSLRKRARTRDLAM